MNLKTSMLIGLAGVALAAAVPATAEETLKVGTVAPEKSPWGQVIPRGRRCSRRRPMAP